MMVPNPLPVGHWWHALLMQFCTFCVNSIPLQADTVEHSFVPPGNVPPQCAQTSESSQFKHVRISNSTEDNMWMYMDILLRYESTVMHYPNLM